ncbi:MAG: aminotransferase class I/II-fold pyridoxal phosphate-dependent enzyme [Clostridia bacterium]|nr:aminotransferase class I/II-fold pyridoxal phosphate-dependent enzyme [Clostridia bacterium]
MTINAPIYEFLMNHSKKNAISFHMPGHKGGAFFKKYGYEGFLENIIKYDVTEIHGADNLYHPNEIIDKIQKKYARLYDAKRSFLLVNGTTGGILASILSCVGPNEKLIMARNSHKSTFNALVLGDINPIYIQPELVDDYHVSGQIHLREVEKAVKRHSDAKAVILPSPNYYGICSDIQEISRIIHEHNMILIVDEAHGAHLHFSDHFPDSALAHEADIVINSTHKTLASLTQSAVLHVNSNRVDMNALMDKLQMVQSTSPSYILMASLDINADIMAKHGEELICNWVKNLDEFYDKMKSAKHTKIMNGSKKIKGFDPTKINIDMTDIGITGKKLEEILREKYNIYMELVTPNIVMGMTGIGTTKEHLDKLAEALLEIETHYSRNESIHIPHVEYEENQAVLKPSQAAQKEKAWENFEDSIGKVCAIAVTPYPPGVPMIYPGEVFTEKIITEIIKIKKDILILGLKNEKKVAIVKGDHHGRT